MIEDHPIVIAKYIQFNQLIQNLFHYLGLRLMKFGLISSLLTESFVSVEDDVVDELHCLAPTTINK